MCIITVRFHGVVGYHICFTYIGSPVRTRVEPLLYLCSFLIEQEKINKIKQEERKKKKIKEKDKREKGR